MKKFVNWLKAYFCRHTFQTVSLYDRFTEKALCTKCGNQYVVNKRYKWKFKLDDVSEKDYENLRKDIQMFQDQYSRKG